MTGQVTLFVLSWKPAPIFMIKKLSLIVLILLYVGAGFNHFLNPDFYISIMPPYIPAHGLMVALSGVAEILLGLALIPKRTRRIAAENSDWIFSIICSIYGISNHQLYGLV